MKLKYKFIEFVLIGVRPKTEIYACQNIKSSVALGEVKWHPAWRRYCYFPIQQAVYSGDCLDDISDFLKQINKK